MKNENYINDTFKALGSILVVLLPVLQFGFISLPEDISSLYIDRESFVFASLVTFLLSIFIIFAYRANPYFNLVLDRRQQKKYLKYIRSSNPKLSQGQTEEKTKEEPELPPFALTPELTALLSIVLFLVTSLGFIWIGLNYSSSSISPKLSFIQAVLYILTFATSVYVILHFTYREHKAKQYKRNREERIQRAINLAIENRGFEDIPPINFVVLSEHMIVGKMQLVVQVDIAGQVYNIYTNPSADELYQVSKV